MAIQVNGTEVISNSRALNNIASADATTVATLNSAGVGGGGIAYGAIYVPNATLDYGQALCAITYDASEDKFVATDRNVSFGASWYSTDGTGLNWVENSLDSDIGYCRGGLAASGSGTFIAACNSGKLARSTNLGQTWTSVAPSYSSAGGAGGDWTSMSYGNGVFLGGYRDQYIFRSTNDGVSWSQPTNPAGSGYYITDFANDGGNNWLATALNSVLKSTDNGATWTNLGQKNPPSVNVNWYQIATDGNGNWMVAGQSGYVGYSSDFGSTWSYKRVDNQNFQNNPASGSYGPSGFMFAHTRQGGFFASGKDLDSMILQGPDNRFSTISMRASAQSTTTKAAVITSADAVHIGRYET